MTVKAIPGPWKSHEEFQYGRRKVYVVHNGERVRRFIALVLSTGNPDDDLRDANALLIAAAPDLLAALKAVVRVADRKTVEFDAARAAIAKAEGKP
jgi:hypothetical protein